MDATISLRSLLGELDPERCKLHCAVWNGSRHPSDVLVESWTEWEGWNRWRGSKNDFNRDFIFSLAVVPGQPSHWLFGGVFEVLARDDTPNSYAYDLRFREDFLPGHVGRLKVEYHNLTFALLEFWSMRTPDAEVLEREDYWKRVLLSRGEFGMNAN